ncbi:MAG: hypothetical protein GC137_08510 [Alphaproteobacteria bacterium]|nr:hypothetical protein [Alphaproteobacteria bacterium]
MKFLLNAGIAVLGGLSLASCDMYEKTYMTEKPMQVKEETVTYDLNYSEVNDQFITVLADHYNNHGGSPLDVVLTYDPKSYRNTAMKATENIAEIKSALEQEGVSDVNGVIMPIKAQGDEAKLIISYVALSAHAPEDCNGQILGEDNKMYEEGSDYKLGCSVKSMIAKQISKPADLLGKGGGYATSDGRAATNIIDAQRTGARNQPLDVDATTDTGL